MGRVCVVDEIHSFPGSWGVLVAFVRPFTAFLPNELWWWASSSPNIKSGFFSYFVRVYVLVSWLINNKKQNLHNGVGWVGKSTAKVHTKCAQGAGAKSIIWQSKRLATFCSLLSSLPPPNSFVLLTPNPAPTVTSARTLSSYVPCFCLDLSFS